MSCVLDRRAPAGTENTGFTATAALTGRLLPARRRSAHDTYLHASSPWRVSALSSLLRSCGLGVAGIGVAWVGCANTGVVTVQARWLALGVGALIVASWGMTRWLLLGFRDVKGARAEVLPELDRRAQRLAPTSVVPVDQIAFVPDGARRFHVPSCALAQGKTGRTVPLQRIDDATLLPCGVCCG